MRPCARARTGEPCEAQHSTCGGRNELCIGRGPEFAADDFGFRSNAVIAARQAEAAARLWLGGGGGGGGLANVSGARLPSAEHRARALAPSIWLHAERGRASAAQAHQQPKHLTACTAGGSVWEARPDAWKRSATAPPPAARPPRLGGGQARGGSPNAARAPPARMLGPAGAGPQGCASCPLNPVRSPAARCRPGAGGARVRGHEPRARGRQQLDARRPHVPAGHGLQLRRRHHRWRASSRAKLHRDAPLLRPGRLHGREECEHFMPVEDQLCSWRPRRIRSEEGCPLAAAAAEPRHEASSGIRQLRQPNPRP